MDVNEELKKLLAETLCELSNHLWASDQDTIDYVDSLIDRARNLGVKI